MQTETIVASDSHLGRSKGDTITRPSLMKELAARGIRIPLSDAYSLALFRIRLGTWMSPRC